MEQLTRVSRVFYALALIVYGAQQFVYGNFRNVQLPPWQNHFPLLPVWAYITGLGLVAAGVCIILNKRARKVSLITGGVFFAFLCIFHIPYELISEPNKSYHLGLWTGALKELALSGGAFILAGSYIKTGTVIQGKSILLQLMTKLVPFGHIFFSITMVSFGIAHFMYIDFIDKLVPDWVPDPIFWTYFAAVALIGSGTCIILDIQRKKIALLLGVMILLWVFTLHIPRAFANPTGERGNELSSVFDALAFTGTAFMIALGQPGKKDE